MKTSGSYGWCILAGVVKSVVDMFTRKKKEDALKKIKQPNLHGFFVGLFIFIMVSLYLSLLVAVVLFSSFFVFISQMGSDVYQTSIVVDDSMNRTISIQEDYYGVIQNELKLAADLYEEGAFETEPENIKTIFGDTAISVCMPSGEYSAGEKDLPISPQDTAKFIRNYNKDSKLSGKTEDGFLVFLRPAYDGNYVMTYKKPEEETAIIEKLTSIEDIITSNATDHSGMIAFKDDKYLIGSNEFTFFDDTPLEECVTFDTIAAPLNGDNGPYAYLMVTTVYDRLYITVRSPENNHGIVFYYFFDLVYLISHSAMLVGIVFLMVLLVLTVIIYFVYQYRKIHPETDAQTMRELKMRSLILAAAGMLITGTVGYYARTLLSLSTYVLDDEEELLHLKMHHEHNQEDAVEVENAFSRMYSKQTAVLGNYLTLYPENRTKEKLRHYSEMFGMEYIILFDQEGKEVLSDADYINMELSRNKADASWQFRSILNGTPLIDTHIVQDDLTGELRHLVGAHLLTADRQPDGLLMTAYQAARLQNAVNAFSLESLLNRQTMSSQRLFFLIDPETREFAYSSIPLLDKSSADDFGFTDTVLQEGYSGSVTILGTKFSITQTTLEDKYLYLALPYSLIFTSRVPFTILISITSLILFLISASLMRRMKMKAPVQKTNSEEAEQPANEENTPVSQSIIPGQIILSEDLFKGDSSSSDMYAEEKTTRLIVLLIRIFEVIVFVLVLLRNQVLPRNSIINYVLRGGWRYGMNVFALTAVLILFIVTRVTVRFATTILGVFARIVSPRAETYIWLFNSAVKYISVLAAGYVSLTMLGVKMETLLATSSIMVLLVSMGAQDLTEDIIAGLFLMFESEFKVGDVIDISGTIGVVKEIGLHSTKLIDENNNVLLISNSHVKNIINRTQNSSYTFSTFTLPNTIPIRDLEQIFKEELPAVKEKHPQFIGTPYFMGVDKFSGGSMQCTVAAESSEANRVEMEQILNKEIQQILTKHGITIG